MSLPRIFWTAAEDSILQSCSNAEASIRLPSRTFQAIKTRRGMFAVFKKPASVRWTAAEDRRLRRYLNDPINRLEKRFKNRSREAVISRRTIARGGRVKTPWKTTEVAKLRLLFPSATRSELLSAFPNHPWNSISATAGKEGLRRQRLVISGNELFELVRQRSREDKISLYQLGVQTGCSSYFVGRKSSIVDMNKISKAVEFFGGKLVIDWQDE